MLVAQFIIGPPALQAGRSSSKLTTHTNHTGEFRTCSSSCLTLTILPDPMPFLTTFSVCCGVKLWGGSAEALMLSAIDSMEEPCFSSRASVAIAADII